MAKVTSIGKARSAVKERKEILRPTQGFTPCSPDMTICGDCEGNRIRNKCPRLREWLAKQGS